MAIKGYMIYNNASSQHSVYIMRGSEQFESSELAGKGH
jgi:hypothetical protein